MSYFDDVSDKDRREEIVKLQAANPATGEEWLHWGAPESCARDNSDELAGMIRAHGKRRSWSAFGCGTLPLVFIIAAILVLTYIPVVRLIQLWNEQVGVFIK